MLAVVATAIFIAVIGSRVSPLAAGIAAAVLAFLSSSSKGDDENREVKSIIAAVVAVITSGQAAMPLYVALAVAFLITAVFANIAVISTAAIMAVAVTYSLSESGLLNRLKTYREANLLARSANVEDSSPKSSQKSGFDY
jgi:hypothetical protein